MSILYLQGAGKRIMLSLLCRGNQDNWIELFLWETASRGVWLGSPWARARVLPFSLAVLSHGWTCFFYLLWAEASHRNGSSCGAWAVGAGFSSYSARGQKVQLLGPGQGLQLWCMCLVAPWHLGSSRDQTCPLHWQVILNHWTTREVPGQCCFEFTSLLCWVVSLSHFASAYLELLEFPKNMADGFIGLPHHPEMHSCP